MPVGDLALLRGAALRDRFRARFAAAQAVAPPDSPLGREINLQLFLLDEAVREAVEALEGVIERASEQDTVTAAPRRTPPARAPPSGVSLGF
ncbi:hypothetical protein [Methylobacterium sp. 37f]|uniref:hypothetical protein n=1 Tax=Methylobacterium sp. 37f TaxID=2817058 RepID=UPI001FFC7D3F|nr:hypothetical protein [Methylobacterium sp. 37f]MCK2055308.1 hypothetical protein [Methylobacterium sp. 37f]